MEVEERLRKVENTLSFLRGAIVVGTAAVVVYMGVTTFVQIPNQVTEQVGEEIGQETQATINEALTKANVFLQHDAHDIWPDGSYCILRGSGICPTGFSQIDGHIWAINMADKTETYLKPSRFGGSSLGLHSGGQSPNWYGDINLSACCK